MSKLINVNIHELLKNKFFYLINLICIGAGVLFSAGFVLFPNFNMPEGSDLVLTSENILGFSPSFASIVIPFAASATVAIMLESQYNHGTIRNRLISGHTRTEMFFSNLITMSVAAFIYFLCYEVTVISVAVLAFGYDGYKVKAVSVSLLVLYLMIIATGTLLSLVIGNFMSGGKITIVVLVVQYLLNISLVLGMFKKDNEILDLISRIFPQSNTFTLSYGVVADGIEKNFIISLVLIVILCGVGLFHFKKCDIK